MKRTIPVIAALALGCGSAGGSGRFSLQSTATGKEYGPVECAPGKHIAIGDANFTSGTTVVQKMCGKCRMLVSVSSRPGQRCPHCFAYWSGEQTQFGGLSGW